MWLKRGQQSPRPQTNFGWSQLRRECPKRRQTNSPLRLEHLCAPFGQESPVTEQPEEELNSGQHVDTFLSPLDLPSSFFFDSLDSPFFLVGLLVWAPDLDHPAALSCARTSDLMV